MRAIIRSVLTASLLATACLHARADEPATTRPSARYSTQTVVLPGGLAAAVAITDHAAQKLYFYEMERDGLVLRETIDLTAAGQPTIARVRAEREPPAPATAETRPASVGLGVISVPDRATVPAAPPKPVTYVALVGDGKLQANGTTIDDADLPLFAREIAAGRRLILRSFIGGDVKALVAARDRLKAAGVDDVQLEGAPDSADDRSTISVVLSKNNALRTSFGNPVAVPDDQLALFDREYVAGRPVRVSPGSSEVALTQLAAARDRLKAAGIADVTFAGQAE